MGIAMKNLIKKMLPQKKVNIKANLFIIGGQKCGTSTLFDNLINHHDIHGGEIKEKNFFSHENLFNKGQDWYHSLFPSIKTYNYFKPIYFLDASPSYLYRLNVAELIHNYNPNAKFIIMMRNPIDRAFSAWNMYKKFHKMNDKDKLINRNNSGNSKYDQDFKKLINSNSFPSFEQMINCEIENFSLEPSFPGLLVRGIYFNQIKRYYDVFSENKFFFICSEEFKINKNKIFKDLFTFLQIDNSISDNIILKDVHQLSYDNKIDLVIREKLIQFYKPYNEKLFLLINKKYDWNK
jgi:hypothetical protein